MPTYEYECNWCTTRFERKQSVHEPPVQTCPECGGPVRKLFHPAGIIFKGSGFYKTDYGSSSGSSSSSSDTKSEPAKTESKPADAAKPEAKSEAKSEKPEAK